MRGRHCNTNAQVRDLERLVKQLPKQTFEPEPADRPRSRARTARRLNGSETEQLIACYQAGAKLRELGAQFGIHPETAGLLLRRNGIEMRANGLRPDQELEAERLYGTGLSLKRVGERLGVDGRLFGRSSVDAG